MDNLKEGGEFFCEKVKVVSTFAPLHLHVLYCTTFVSLREIPFQGNLICPSHHRTKKRETGGKLEKYYR